MNGVNSQALAPAYTECAAAATLLEADGSHDRAKPPCAAAAVQPTTGKQPVSGDAALQGMPDLEEQQPLKNAAPLHASGSGSGPVSKSSNSNSKHLCHKSPASAADSSTRKSYHSRAEGHVSGLALALDAHKELHGRNPESSHQMLIRCLVAGGFITLLPIICTSGAPCH